MAATKTEQFKKILDDAELREHAMSALQSVQHAVEEARATEKQISKKAQKKLKKQEQKAKHCKKNEKKSAEPAIVAEAPSEEPAAKAKKKRHPVRKLLFVATVGAVVAMVVSEDARKAVLDALFGAEEEFQYTSQPASGAGVSSNGAS